jgi:hypothetical protein
MIHYTGVDLGLFFALELKAGISMHHYTGVDVDLLAKDAASGCKAGTGIGMIHCTGVDLDLSLKAACRAGIGMLHYTGVDLYLFWISSRRQE